jgi:hypothetical protein
MAVMRASSSGLGRHRQSGWAIGRDIRFGVPVLTVRAGIECCQLDTPVGEIPAMVFSAPIHSLSALILCSAEIQPKSFRRTLILKSFLEAARSWLMPPLSYGRPDLHKLQEVLGEKADD